jgi:hypothetical protein
VDSADADNERDDSDDYDLTGYEGEECDTSDAPRSSSEDDSKDPPSANLSNSATLGFPPSPRPSLPSTTSGAALVSSHLIQSLKRKSPPAPAEVDEPSSKKLRQKETSKSAQSEARSRAEADQGIVHLRNFYRFKSKIRILDPYAEFLINDNPRFVRHSECANVLRMKAAGNTTNFKQHLKRCKGPTASTTYIPLLNFPFPCPGLTPERDERIRTYLVRSQTAGGGSPSRPAIAQDLFGTSYKDLQPEQRKKVLRVEAVKFQWINFREQELILSASCLKRSLSQHEPCARCLALSTSRHFESALRRKLPTQENLKFTAYTYRAQTSTEQCAKMAGVHEIFQRATAVS